MRSILVFVLFCLMATVSLGQKYAVERPVPPTDITEYLKKNIPYPQGARDAGVQGSAVLKFTIDAEGNVSNIVIQKGIGSGCEDEIKRILLNMPRWKPGTRDGIPVEMLFYQKVRFKLM